MIILIVTEFLDQLAAMNPEYIFAAANNSGQVSESILRFRIEKIE
jgi:hypothetical protein